MKNSLWMIAMCGLMAGCLSQPEAKVVPAEPAGEFSNLTIDLGVVVSDIDAAAKFYTQVIGFKEVKGFFVPAEMGRDAGLADSKPLGIRVFHLGEGPGATSLKLMQVEGSKPARQDQAFIHSTLGFSYITIRVKDTTVAMARLKQHGIKPLAKGPYALPAGFPQGIYLTVIRDPDGNFVELVGPKS